MTTIKESTLDLLQSELKLYLRDFDALSPEQLSVSPGGVARTPLDITFECAAIHDFLLHRLKGLPVPNLREQYAYNADGFMTCAEGKSVAEVREWFRQSLQDVIDLVASKDESQMMDLVKTGSGEEPFFSLAIFVAYHTTYHHGQLTLIQALGGDGKGHWG